VPVRTHAARVSGKQEGTISQKVNNFILLICFISNMGDG
jgi:hypothetical protein